MIKRKRITRGENTREGEARKIEQAGRRDESSGTISIPIASAASPRRG